MLNRNFNLSDVRTTLNGNGTANLGVFYTPVEVNKAVKRPFFSGLGDSTINKPIYYIRKPSKSIHRLIVRSANQLNEEMAVFTFTSNEEEAYADLVNLSLVDFIDKYGSGFANEIKNSLEHDGFTGLIIQSTTLLDKSRLSNSNRFLLSYENFYIYSLGRAILGLGLEDVEGVTTSVINNLDQVKSAINQIVAINYLNQNRLQRTQQLVDAFKNKLSTLNLSYDGQDIDSLLSDIYSELSSSRDLYDIVFDYLNSGTVALPENLSKELIAERMVNYLHSVGFQYEEDDLAGSIEGIGPGSKRLLEKQGIRSFKELANTSVDALKNMLANAGRGYNTVDPSTWPKQAELIVEGKFEELKEFQDTLNNRKKPN